MEKKMEEQKPTMKVVSDNNEKEEQKLTYEQLNEACGSMTQQIQQMQTYIQKCHEQIKALSDLVDSKRLDYLFKVLENEHKFKDPEFIIRCTTEIKESLVAPEEKEESKKN